MTLKWRQTVTIKVADLDFQLKFVTDPFLAYEKNIYGLTDFVACVISLSNGPPAQRVYAVLWHELGHTIMDHLDWKKEDLDEESLSDLMQFGVPMLLRDNPWLGSFTDFQRHCQVRED